MEVLSAQDGWTRIQGQTNIRPLPRRINISAARSAPVWKFCSVDHTCPHKASVPHIPHKYNIRTWAWSSERILAHPVTLFTITTHAMQVSVCKNCQILSQAGSHKTHLSGLWMKLRFRLDVLRHEELLFVPVHARFHQMFLGILQLVSRVFQSLFSLFQLLTCHAEQFFDL